MRDIAYKRSTWTRQASTSYVSQRCLWASRSRRLRKRARRSRASSGVEMTRKATANKTESKKTTAKQTSPAKTAAKRIDPKAEPKQKNLDIYGAKPLPWSCALKQ